MTESVTSSSRQADGEPRPCPHGLSGCEHLDFRPRAQGDNRPRLGDTALWLTWEKQRRTTELSHALGLQLFRFNHRGSRLKRYVDLCRQTWRLFKTEKPRLVIVQNPSMILAAAAAFMKSRLGFTLVVDRHTNFMIGLAKTPVIRLLTLISDYSLRQSDLTIVTNGPLAQLAEAKGSPAFVLPDRIPAPPPTQAVDLGPGRHICFICTYATDEPYNEVIGLGPLLPPDVTLHITGRQAGAAFTPEARQILDTHDNVVLTDFLPEEDYWTLLASVDAVMDLTTLDHCLVCGAYESLALGQPLILSQKPVNRDLFGDTPVLVNPDTTSILEGVTTLLADLPARRQAAQDLRRTFSADWDRDFARLQARLLDMAAPEQGD